MRLSKAFRTSFRSGWSRGSDGKGRVAAFEILKSTMRTREYVKRARAEGKTLLDAMRDGDTEGMQCFDGEIEKLIRAGTIDIGNWNFLFDQCREPAACFSPTCSKRARTISACASPKVKPAESAFAVDPELETLYKRLRELCSTVGNARELVVDVAGIEPAASSLRTMRSPN